MLHSAVFLPVSVFLNTEVSCLPVTLQLERTPESWPCSQDLKMGGESGERDTLKDKNRLFKEEGS